MDRKHAMLRAGHEGGPAYFVESISAPYYNLHMPRAAPGPTNRVTDDASHLSDAERADLLASLAASRAEYAAGRYHVLKPGMLRKEFEAILEGDPTDEELNVLLGVVRPESP